MPNHPMQPIELVGDIPRFKENKIVRFLFNAGPFDLNQLGLMPFSPEDREQFMQLIGYSVSGYGDLDYIDPKTIRRADKAVDKLLGNNDAN